MANYKILTGPFEGSIVEEGSQILDVDFSRLDDDLQLRVRDWADQQIGSKYTTVNGGADYARKGGADTPIPMNEIKEDYETSWDTEETEEAPNLKSVSEW